MKRLLLDVNVVLDALLARAPHADAAMKLWAAIETRIVTGCLSAHAITTLFCLLARARDAAYARRAVGDLMTLFRVARVDQAVLERALALGWGDFEDAVCAAAAEAAGCDLIVSRDPAGFRGSRVPTVDAATALALLEPGGEPGRLAERPRSSYGARRQATTRRKRGAPRPGRPAQRAARGR